MTKFCNKIGWNQDQDKPAELDLVHTKPTGKGNPSDEHHHLHSECRPASQKWYDLVLQVTQPTAQSGTDAQGSLQTAEIVDDSRSHWELQLFSGVEWYWYDSVFTLWALSSLTSTTEEGQELFESELQDQLSNVDALATPLPSQTFLLISINRLLQLF